MIWRCLFCYRWNSLSTCTCGKSEKASELIALIRRTEKEECLVNGRDAMDPRSNRHRGRSKAKKKRKRS